MRLSVTEFGELPKPSLYLAGWLCYWNLLHLFLDTMFNGESPVIPCRLYPFTFIFYIVLLCGQATVSAFDEDADYDVLNHPIVDLIYYTVSNIFL